MRPGPGRRDGRGPGEPVGRYRRDDGGGPPAL
jgi:hypothetical protein